MTSPVADSAGFCPPVGLELMIPTDSTVFGPRELSSAVAAALALASTPTSGDAAQGGRGGGSDGNCGSDGNGGGGGGFGVDDIVRRLL